MPDFVIKTTFRGADKLSPVLKRLGIGVKQVGDQATRSFKRASRQASVFGGVVKGVLAAGAVQRAFSVASMAVRALGVEFLEFDTNVTKAVTRLPGGLDRTSQAFLDMGKIARREAARTEFSAAQTSGAIEQLALAGFNLEQSMSALPGTINLATNAAIGVEEATTIAAKTLGAFGLKTKDTTQLTANLARVNDVFSRTVSSATLDITGLFETLKFGGPAAHSAGQSLETFATATGVLADSAIDASIAGTSLRRAFINLAAPTPRMAKELKKLKVQVDDGKGGFRDFFDILQDVEKGMTGYGKKQRLASLATIFGARAVGAMDVLLQKGVGSLREFRKGLEESGGASKKMSDTIRGSLQNRLLILRSATIELGFQFLEAFAGKAGEGVDAAIKAVQKFDVKPVVQGVKDVIKFSMELFDTLKPFLRWLPELIGLWVAYRAALITVTTVQAIVFFVKMASAIKAAAAAQGLLNLVMLANPLGLVIAAVFALIVALGILVTNYDEIVNGWEVAFMSMEIVALKVWISIKRAAASFINGILEIISAAPVAFGKIFGFDASALQLPKVDFVSPADLAALKEAQRLKKEIITEGVGQGVGRGAAGFRGGGLGGGAPKAPAGAPVSDIYSQISQELSIPKAGSSFAPAAAASKLIQNRERATAEAVQELMMGKLGNLQSPNVEEAKARIEFEGRISFENAPEGTSFESDTTGAPPISTEGLGAQ